MRYVTCHPELKHRANGLCNKCYHISWIIENRDKARAYGRNYYHKNPNKCRAISDKSKAARPERVRELAKISERKRRALGLIDPIKARIHKSEWKKRNPENGQVNLAKRRARLHGAEINDFTAAQWKLMKIVYDNACFYCSKTNCKLTQDHIVPISHGGNHTSTNIVPACVTCNCKKNNKDIKEFINALDPASLGEDLSLFRYGVRSGSGVLLMDCASR